MTQVYLSRAIEKVGAAANECDRSAEGDMLRSQLAILRRLAKHEPFNTVELRQTIAQKMIDRESSRWFRNRSTQGARGIIEHLTSVFPAFGFSLFLSL